MSADYLDDLKSVSASWKRSVRNAAEADYRRETLRLKVEYNSQRERIQREIREAMRAPHPCGLEWAK